VENCIQDCKSTTKFRCSADPEVLLVNRLMTQHALAVVKRDHGYRDGQRYVQTLDERVSKPFLNGSLSTPAGKMA